MISTISDVAKVLLEAKRVLIFPHGSMDGDALGSSVAICRALRQKNVDSHIIIDEKIPDNIAFLNKGECVDSFLDFEPGDISVCVDNGEVSRLGDRKAIFEAGKKSVCIDHHASTKPIFDYNLLDAQAAAAAELVFDLIQEMDCVIDIPIAEAIYTGIVTDTGRFQYSNTESKTHRIAAELLDRGLDHDKISIEVYQNVSMKKIKLELAILNTLDLLFDGKVGIVHMTKDMLNDTGALEEDSEGIIEIVRNIRGVRVAVFIKEKNENKMKVSLRSKYNYDVGALSVSCGGGGHMHAAGFDFNGSCSDAKKTIVNQFSNNQEELNA